MNEEGDQGGVLPPTIAAAWGLRDRPGKGPKPGLSVNRIVDAAIQTAVVDGLGAVSMNRVARKLGTAAMSLYRYVSGKDELLVLMGDVACGPPPEIPEPQDDWRSGLSRWAFGLRAAYLENSWMLRIPISGPPLTPNTVAWMDRALRCLSGTRLSEGDKVSVLLLLSGYVRSDATLATSLDDTETMMPTYGRMLAEVIDADRFPALTVAVAAGVFDEPDEQDYDFAFGLDRILDGVETLINAEAANPTPT